MSNPTGLLDLARDLFEAHYAASCTYLPSFVRRGDYYEHRDIQNAWHGWQLARRAQPGGEAPQAEGLTRYSMWSNPVGHGMDPSPSGDWVSFDEVRDLLATQSQGALRAHGKVALSRKVADAASRAQQAAAPGVLLAILRDVHDTLASESDSDIDHFEDDDEEREGAPVQYAARKVMEVMDMLKAAAPSAPGTPEAPTEWKKALHAAVCAIYFDDSSDFRSALGSVVRHLDADLAGELLSNPKAAYDRSAAQLDGGQGEKV